MFLILIIVIFTVVVHSINFLLTMTIIRPPFKPQPRSTTALSLYGRLARLLVHLSVVVPTVNIQYSYNTFKSNKLLPHFVRQKRRSINHLIIPYKSKLASLHYSTAFCLIPCLLVDCCVMHVVCHSCQSSSRG